MGWVGWGQCKGPKLVREDGDGDEIKLFCGASKANRPNQKKSSVEKDK